jgi:hypothetical protein
VNVKFSTVYLLNHEGRVLQIVPCSSIKGAEDLVAFFRAALAYTQEPLYVPDKPMTPAWEIVKAEVCHA